MPLFANPAVLLAFYDPFLQSEECQLFPWQIKIHEDFAQLDDDQPKEIMAVVTNGGGKSSFLLGPAAAWTGISFEQSQTAITSASVAQLDLQTMRACKRLANYMNSYHKADLWECQHRHMEFKPTGSFIDARKSDLEGTQEGFHPQVPGGEFTILVDEGKTIEPEIYKGILKWTGATRRLDVSSAGEPTGTFYHNLCFGNARNYIIDADQCPNIKEADKKRVIAEAGGADTPLAMQILKSQFAALAGTVVILLQDVERCIRLAREGAIQHLKEDHNEAGLDLSGGGDETVLSVRNGNKQIGLEPMIFPDERKTENMIADILIPKYDLRMEHIRADAGGMGRVMIRHIQEKVINKHGKKYGERMNMIYNQSSPRGVLKANFGNRGAQMWFSVGNLIKECTVILLDDAKQTTQFANRYYDQRASSDKIFLEPKPTARAQGRPSPDRADGTVLAFENYRGLNQPQDDAKESRKMTPDQLEAFMDDLHNKRFLEPKHRVGPITMEDLAGAQMNPRQLAGLFRR